MRIHHRHIACRLFAAGALVALGAGCVLAPRGTAAERRRAALAGRAWERPPAERVLPDVPADADWHALLEHAFLANGDLEAAYHEWRAALARIDVAAGWPNTNASFSYEYLFSSGNLKGWDRTTLGVGFDPMQNLSFPTKAMASGRVALAGAQAAGARFEAMKFDLQRRVLVAWADWALLGERLRVQRALLDLRRLRVASAAGRLLAGGLEQEWLRADVDAGMAEDALRRLEAEVPQQRARLNALAARPAGAPLALPAALPAPRAMPADDAALLALGAAANRDVAALAHEVASRDAAVDRARQEFIPDINPFASTTGSMEQVAGMMASLPTRVPIILGGIREARAMLARADAMARQAVVDRRADFVATLAALRDLERQAALVDARLLPGAERTAANARARYETGGLPAADWLEAESLVLELRLLRAEARSARDARLAELEALAGVDVETLAPVRHAAAAVQP
jgi:cobalt-zinc-cadmium efflux system outer membrane protein